MTSHDDGGELPAHSTAKQIKEFGRSITWQPAGMPASLAIDLPALFEDALG